MENGGSGIGEQAKRDAQRIAGDVQDRIEGVRGYAEEAGDWVREFAREKPMAALGLAVGLGFLFGRLLSRA